MSEYTYACPVCGQHMRCDSSQAGTAMECPTCFQKITAPQAPAGDGQKFVLTGTKVGERPISKIAAKDPIVVPAAKSFPWGMVILLLLAGLAGGGGFAFRGKLFHGATAANRVSAPAAPSNPAEASPPKAVPVILPPASDTNWTLNLDTVTAPEAAAVGRVHAQSSTLDRVIFQGGVLTLRPSVKGSPDVSLAVNFSGALPAAIAGKTIRVQADAPKAARVTLRWKEDGQSAKAVFTNGYALRLEMGILTNNHMAGKIYFCAPDEAKSYALGAFIAEVRLPKPPKPKP